jgi:hypothetical protein
LGARSRQFESGRPDHLKFQISGFISNSMSALYAVALSTFKEMGWHYREVPEQEVIESDFEAHHTKIPLHMQIFGETHIASVVALSSLQVPSTHRLAVSELIMRTNKELNLGNFELEWDSGQVMFRISNVFPPNRHDAAHHRQPGSLRRGGDGPPHALSSARSSAPPKASCCCSRSPI